MQPSHGNNALRARICALHIPSKFYQVPCNLKNPLHRSKSTLSLCVISLKLLSLPSSSSPISSLSSPLQHLSRAGANGETKATAKDKEWGLNYEGQAMSIAGPPPVEDRLVVEINSLKRKLVESFNEKSSGDQTRAKIVELITQLEARADVAELIARLEANNPHPAPTEALPLFDGKWNLVYTSFLGLFPLLSRQMLPLVTAEEISENLNTENSTVQHSIRFSGPLAPASVTVSTNSNFVFGTPRRVQVKFMECIIGTLQPIDNIALPENVKFLGQNVDISPFKGLIDSLNNTASSVARTISSQPPLKFNLPQIGEVWLLVTYLDGEIRIARSDVGSVFVFLKEGSASPEQT